MELVDSYKLGLLRERKRETEHKLQKSSKAIVALATIHLVRLQNFPKN